jgi:LemA protein
MLSQALGRLLAISEAYPDLKANQNFQALQTELTSTEDRIASSRRYYNALVRDLNTKVESVPTNFVANLAGIKRAEYFETSAVEAQVPNVSFGNQAPGTLGNAATPPVVGAPSTQPGAVTGPTTQPGQSQSASGLPQAQAPDPTIDRHTPNE